MASEGYVDELKARASNMPSLQLSERSVCDLELLATGGFSPLDRFMSREDHLRVLDEMRLANGHVFPIPVTLPVGPDIDIRLDQEIALRNSMNELLAVMTIEEIYEWDLREVASKVFGTPDLRHPHGGRNASLGQGQHIRSAADTPIAHPPRFPAASPHPSPGPR